jgi:hypothetical protein
MKTKLLFSCLLSSTFLFAQNIFKDDLLTYTPGQVLSGQGSWTNNSTTGGLGSCAGIGCTNATVDNRVMSYLNYGSTTKALTILPNKDGIGRELIPSITNGDLYIGMVLNLTNAFINANDFFRVVNGAISSVGFRMYAEDTGESNGKYKIGIKKAALGNSTEFASDLLNYNSDNLIILKYTFGPNVSDDILSVYINPVYANGEPMTSSATTNVGEDQANDIDRVAFRLNQNVAMPTGAVSLISVARTWFDLGFIPLAINEYDNKPLTIISTQAKNGILAIDSNRAINNATLNIYTITGQLLEKQMISLEPTSNEIIINPIATSSIYLIEVIEITGKKQVQKIIIN